MSNDACNKDIYIYIYILRVKKTVEIFKKEFKEYTKQT